MDPIAIQFLLCATIAPIICAVAMWIVCTGVRARYASPESRDELNQKKKLAFGYKVAATVLFGLPSVFSFVLLLFVSLIGSSSGGNSLYGLIIIFCSIGLFISFLASFWGYNYLFLAKNNFIAGLILAIPFFPIVFSIVVGFIAGNPDVGLIILLNASMYIISWIVMLCLLTRKRNSLP